ncbi:hypothetical protein QBC38DRAFT_510464 [Podospora fimiseda]|uniref:Diaminohydroxyphosphoribosylamino-pyrimidine deaminase n=1 Tax=Podospora fimiseda TaxID=252190 RepID=A0AAN7BN39_9PEZI|nr:hypothetical protein QBC38DRAFT_510464 [Podospora fimiseda]
MTGNLEKLIRELGEPVEDAEEETFDLFSQSLPSQNLGFIDSKAQTLDLTIAGRDLTIHQSPAVLSSNRAGGTTGAVVWKITPLLATYLSTTPTFSSIFSSSPSFQILELGCGISGLIGLLLSPKISKYILTDQPYVSKLIEQNITENHLPHHQPKNKKKKQQQQFLGGGGGELIFKPLDWESTQVTFQEWGNEGYDLIVACDCIYNDALINPLVDTCVDVCKLRTEGDGEREREGTICLIAQQLRDDTVFEGWLKKFMQHFKVWRIRDEKLPEGLRSGDGFVIHFGVLKG